jgi:hypothetical protein
MYKGVKMNVDHAVNGDDEQPHLAEGLSSQG